MVVVQACWGVLVTKDRLVEARRSGVEVAIHAGFLDETPIHCMALPAALGLVEGWMVAPQRMNEPRVVRKHAAPG